MLNRVVKQFMISLRSSSSSPRIEMSDGPLVLNVTPRAVVNSCTARRHSSMTSSILVANASRYSVSSRCSRLSVTSATVRMIETGVRSSCDASAMNCRCVSSAPRRRPTRPLLAARRAIWGTGRRPIDASHHPPAPASSSASGITTNIASRTSRCSRARSVSGRATTRV